MTRLREYLPGVGEPIVRYRLEQIFSREMLGAVFVAASAAKIVEKVLNLAVGPSDDVAQLVGWTVVFVGAIAMFVWWERVAEMAGDAAEEASDHLYAPDERHERSASVTFASAAVRRAEEAEDRASELAVEAESLADDAEQAALEASEAKREAKEADRAEEQ